MKIRSKPLERNQRISAKRTSRSKPLERAWGISKETRQIDNKEQTAQKGLENCTRRSQLLERD